MTPARIVAGAQLTTGLLLVRRPRPALTLLGYPHATFGPRLVVGVLGMRHVAQGAAELRGSRPVLLAGAAVDVLHACTALFYAHTSTLGRRAGRRNAAVALTFAAAELLAAARTAPSAPAPGSGRCAGASSNRGRPSPHGSADEPVARVAGPHAAAWPEPTDSGQHVLIDYPAAALVRLRGGAMDGATVTLAPGESSYSITDTEHGPLYYRALPGTRDQDRLPVLRLSDPTSERDDGGDAVCWPSLVCEQCGAIAASEEPRCPACDTPR